MYDTAKVIGGCITILLIMVLAVCLFAFPIMWLWNWLMPVLFGLPTITWTQAWGLGMLCSLLFKSNNVQYK